MSPEVMQNQNHTFVSDFFAIGIIGYEFMFGKRPYKGRSRKEIKEQIMAKQVEIKIGDIPIGWSEESADFFNKLLIRKPEYRLGSKGYKEIKEHIWIKYFNWKKLFEKKIVPSFIPYKKENFDKRYCQMTDNISEETKLRYERYKNAKEYNNLFCNFTFCRIVSEENIIKNKFENNKNNFRQKRKKLDKCRSKSSNNIINNPYNNYSKNKYKDFESLNQSGSNTLRHNSKMRISSSLNETNKKRTIKTKCTTLYRKKNLLIENPNNNSFYTILNNQYEKNYKQLINSISSKNFIDYYKKQSKNIGNFYRQKFNKKSIQNNLNVSNSSQNFSLILNKNNSHILSSNNKNNISKSFYNSNNNLNNSRYNKSPALYKKNRMNINNNDDSFKYYPNSSYYNKNKSYADKIRAKKNLNINNLSYINKRKENVKYENNISSNKISSSNILKQIRAINKNKKISENNLYNKNILNKKGKNNIKNKLYFEVELNEQYDQYKDNKKNKEKIKNDGDKNSIKLNGVNLGNKININVVINRNSSTTNIINQNFNLVSNSINNKKKNKKVMKRSNSSMNFLFKNYKMSVNNNLINKKI